MELRLDAFISSPSVEVEGSAGSGDTGAISSSSWMQANTQSLNVVGVEPEAEASLEVLKLQRQLEACNVNNPVVFQVLSRF